jgi:putative Ca2+/H+ antiporter (TMEM165/GDT1 family)
MAIFISLWGVITFSFGLFMMLAPAHFADQIVRFSHQRYFHYIEIISRLVIGAVLLLDAHNTSSPLVFEVIGNLLFIIAIILVFMTEKYHKKFALWAGTHCISWFRPAGVSALIFGLWAVYVSIN